MAQINIGGANAAVQLQGYTDTSITTDQTFTFPDTGGELATAAPNGQVPGYQTGTIVPDLRRYNTSDGVNAVDSSIQTPSRRFGKYTRIGNLVTYGFDWAGSVEWGVVNGESWKNDNFVFTAPYANTADPFIQTNGVYRVWQTKIPHGPDTLCSGVLAHAIGSQAIIGFQEVFNTGANSIGGSWELMRCSQTSNGVFEIQFCLTYFTDDTTWNPLFGATVS